MQVPQDIRDQVATIDRALAGLPESCTVPVFAERSRYILPIATGTLVTLADEFFLVTAAHAIAAVAREGLPLCVGDLHGAKVFDLREEIIFTRSTSPVDVAAWRLSTEDVQLFRHKRFLTLEDLWIFDLDPGAGPFFLRGYLADWQGAAGPDMPKGFVNSARIYMSRYREPAPVKFYDPPMHLLFTENAQNIFGPNGERLALPSSGYDGISGSGVFVVSLRGHRHRLVAITTGVHPGAIQGTRVRHLIELIGSKYPDVQRAIIEFCSTADPRETFLS